MGSNIIDSYKKLINLSEVKLSQNWELLFLGSQNNFDWGKFHETCDNKAPTLVVVKSINGSIVGGYTEALWNDTIPNMNGYENCGRDERKYKPDSNAFLFAFEIKNMNPFKAKVQRVEEAIYCDKNCGPAFGKNELQIQFKGPQDPQMTKNNHFISVNIGSSLEGSYKIQKENQEDFTCSLREELEEIDVFQLRSY